MHSGRFGAASLSGRGSIPTPSAPQSRRAGKRQYPEGPHYETKRHEAHAQTVTLVANAVRLTTIPGRFGCLRVFNIAFDGPRPLGLTDQNVKQRILCHRTGPWGSIECPRVLQMRCADGARLFVMDQGTAAKEQLESLDGSTVLLKGRDGTEELWTLTFKEEAASGLRGINEHPDTWLQFVSLLSDAALERGKFTLIGGNNSRIVKTDGKGFKDLRSIRGALAPGFAKALALCEDGLYWTFSPRYTLMLNRTMDEELRELQRDTNDPEQLAALVRRRRLYVVTRYSPGNMYRVMDVSFDKKPTDTFRMRVRQADGEFVDKEVTHIEYLRERYGKEFPPMFDDRIANQPMIGCVLVGRRKQLIRVGRTVHIPAGLLSICRIDVKELPRNVKEEITRHSQRKERETLSEVRDFVAELRSPDIQEAYESFGMSFSRDLKKLEGTVARHRVQVSAGPKGPMPLDDNGNFQQCFSRNSRHWHPPRIGDRYIILVKTDQRGALNDNAIATFLSDMERATKQWGWDFKVPSDPSQVPVVPWTGDQRDLEDKKESLLKRIKRNPQSKPVVLFALIPQKDDADYRAIKRMAYELQLPSQVLTIEVLARLGGQAIFRVLASMAAKFGVDPVTKTASAPWAVQEPLGNLNNVCIMGVATYKKGYPQQGEDSRQSGYGGYGITLTSTDDCLGVVQSFGETHSLSRGGILGDLREHLKPLIHTLRFKHGRKIENLVVYRKGMGDSLVDDCAEIEIRQIELAYEDVMGYQRWNDHTKELTLTNPFWKEKGSYIIEGTLKNGKPFRHEVAAEWAGGADGCDKYIILRLPFGGQPSVPDIHSSGVYCTAPDGRKLLQPKLPAICFTLVNKAHNANLAFFKGELLDQGRQGGGRHRLADAIPACTIVDNFFKGIRAEGTNREEFYVVPSTGVVGFALPVHYSVFTNTTPYSIKEIQDISLRLSYLYFNQFNASKVPYVLRLAEHGAERALTIYEGLTRGNALQETHLFL